MTTSERFVPEGDAYVFGQTPEMARRLLDAAVQAGYDETVVRTGDDGFYVPAALVEIVYPSEPTEEGKS